MQNNVVLPVKKKTTRQLEEEKANCTNCTMEMAKKEGRDEVWKDIVTEAGYQISSWGRVRKKFGATMIKDKNRWRILTTTVRYSLDDQSTGKPLVVYLRIKRKNTMLLVNKLIIAAFLGVEYDKIGPIKYKDDNIFNYSLDNMIYITKRSFR